jgi:tetratricopeptide (TPR) repeat protein
MVEASSWALGVFASLQDWKGEVPGGPAADEALRRAIESFEAADRCGSPFSRCGAFRSLAIGHLLQESWSDAIDAASQALEVAREESGLEREACLLALLSRGHLGRGEREAALAFAREGVAAAESRSTRFFGIEAELALVRALRAARGVEAADEIESVLDRAQQAIDETGGRVLAPQVLEERALLAGLRGDAESADACLRSALELYREIGAAAHAERLESLRGRSTLPAGGREPA